MVYRRAHGRGYVIGATRLERSGVVLSRLGLGTAPLGALPPDVSADRADAVVGAALDAGITHIDTAPMYGAGLAESVVGQALCARRTDGVALSTKAGRLVVPAKAGESAADLVWDMSERGMRRSLEESLQRLGLYRVDILYLHDPDDHEAVAVRHALPELLRMRAEGVVRAIGVGMNSSAMLTRLVEHFDLDVVLVAGRYTLLDQSAADELMPVCRRNGTAVVVGGPFNSGILADPWQESATYDYEPAPPEIVTRARAMAAVAERHGVSHRALALQYPAANPAVASVLVGLARPAEVTEAVAAFTTPVPAAAWEELVSLGFVHPSSPIPEED